MKNEFQTDQELLDTNRQLFAENELLRKEVAYLREQISGKDHFEQEKLKEIASTSNQTKNPIKPALSLKEKVTLFRSLLRGAGGCICQKMA